MYRTGLQTCAFKLSTTTATGGLSADGCPCQLKCITERCKAVDCMTYLRLWQQAHKLAELIKVDVIAGISIQQCNHPRAIFITHLHRHLKAHC